MATATGHLINEIQSSKGGNIIALVELTSSFALPATLTADVNCIDLGHLAESQTAINTSIEKLKNEAKETVKTEREYDGATTGVLMQTSKRILDFVSFTVRDKVYLQYRKAGLNNGKTQEYFSIGEVTPQMVHKNPGAGTACPYEFTPLVQDAAVTIATADISAIETALGISIATTGSVTIPANQEHILIETP